MGSAAASGAAGFALGVALVGALWWATAGDAPPRGASRRPGANAGYAWPDDVSSDASTRAPLRRPPVASRAREGTHARAAATRAGRVDLVEGPAATAEFSDEPLVLRGVTGDITDWRQPPRPEPPHARRATEAHAHAVEAGDAWRRSHEVAVTTEKIEELLASRDGAVVEVGLGLAVSEGRVDILLRCAADETLGSLRAAALDAAAWLAPEDASVAAFVRSAARGNDPVLRATAEALVTSVGVEPFEEAVSRAATGAFDERELTALAARAVAAHKESVVLRQPGAPRALLRGVLDGMPTEWAETDPSLRDVVTALADGHADPLVRETARRRLQDTRPRDGRGVNVLSAIYGVDTRLLDVTDEVRNRMTRGRALFHIWSDLGGDPAVGVTKTLTITYEFAGRRYVRTGQDGGWIELP